MSLPYNGYLHMLQMSRGRGPDKTRHEGINHAPGPYSPSNLSDKRQNKNMTGKKNILSDTFNIVI